VADNADITKNLLEMYGRDDWILRRNFRVFLQRTGLSALPREARILDLGCAMGHLILQLQREGFRSVTGLDAAPAMVEAARKLTGAEILLGDATACDRLAPAGAFDAVIVSDLVHHIDQAAGWDALLAACRGVLRDGGLLALREPWPTPMLRLLYWMSRYRVFYLGPLRARLQSFVDEDHLLRHFFAHWPGSYRERLARHGFTVIADESALVHRLTSCRKGAA
jgi:2-polyprenyl-3-methyl-5-hydroxy-6-metoxy-1,4-benzoquinol methylase